MFSTQEYPNHNAREGFDWDKIVNLIYSARGKELAKRIVGAKKKRTKRSPSGV